MKWACDSLPSKVQLSPAGELLVEMDGEVYKATFENNAWHFNDGDVWTKVEKLDELGRAAPYASDTAKTA